jgi:hypothetical protein
MGKNCQDKVEKKKTKRGRKKGYKNKPKQVPLGDLTNKIGKYSLRTRSQPQETENKQSQQIINEENLENDYEGEDEDDEMEDENECGALFG